MKRFQIIPALVLVLNLISGLSALDCSEQKWRENIVDVFQVRKKFALECGVKTAPDDKYRWTKDGEPLIPNPNIGLRGASLQFFQFSDSDEGIYQCLVLVPHSDGLYEKKLSRTVRLRHPQIEPFTSNVVDYYNVEEYTYVRLECKYKGIIIGDDIDYNWYTGKINQIPHENDRMYYDLTGALHITPVLKIDESVNGAPLRYMCGVTSVKLEFGRFGNDIYLRVKGVKNPQLSVPILKYKSEGVKAPLGKNADLECVFSGYHPSGGISYRWFLEDGSPVSSGNKKYALLFKNRRLRITNVEESDGGVYYCVAENGAGASAREQVTLEVTCN